MRKLMAAGLVLAGIAASTGVTVWMARPVEAQVVGVPGEAIRTLVTGGSRVGAAVRDVTADDLAEAGLAETRGVVVESVSDGGPAAAAGLRAGDVVVEFDGERVRSVRQFVRLVQDTPAGRSVQVAVVRDGARQVLTVTPEDARAGFDVPMPEIRREFERGLRELPRAFEGFDWTTPGLFLERRGQLGVELMTLRDQLAEYFGVEAGVLVSAVVDDSAAARAGLRVGDVITAVDGEAVEDVVDVRAALAEAGEGASVTLAIVRDGNEQTITATLPGDDPAPRTGV